MTRAVRRPPPHVPLPGMRLACSCPGSLLRHDQMHRICLEMAWGDTGLLVLRASGGGARVRGSQAGARTSAGPPPPCLPPGELGTVK